MSPEKARVFVVEDRQDWQEMIAGILRDEGHLVVASSTTLKDALETAKHLREKGVQVATLDGNLNEWDTSGSDARAVLSAIRSNVPEVKVVGLSGSQIRGVDVDLGKANCVDLGRVVKGL